ncbi:MAG: hypothetical protein LC623_00100 [Halobacteriales archaeon]|nr:hypothetical protein [Halobacteriales archaeon]
MPSTKKNANQPAPRGGTRPAIHALGVLAVLLGASAALPAVGADHIRAMAVYQSGVDGLDVTINVDYNPSGNCWGGTFQWFTGETPAASGSIPDGISACHYIHDQSGTGVAMTGPGANGRTFAWSLTAIPADQDDPNLVRLQISYPYNASGTYVLVWNDCCVPSPTDGLPPIAVVHTDAAVPAKKILALDSATDEATLFTNAGIPKCAITTAPTCYDLVADTSLATVNLGAYRAILVGAHASTAALTALTARAADISAFVGGGGGIIVYAQPGADTLLTKHYQWLPGGSAFTHAAETSNEVKVTLKGLTHYSQMDQHDATLSNWAYSEENRFTAWPAYFDQELVYVSGVPSLIALVAGPLVAGAGAGNLDHAIVLAGRYPGTLGASGCVIASGQPTDITAVFGTVSVGPGIGAQEAAEQMFRSNLYYAMTCAQ